MGNILGTLSKFKGEEKNRSSTEKVSKANDLRNTVPRFSTIMQTKSSSLTSYMIIQARRRDEIAKKVALKLDAETTRVHVIGQLERESKNTRFELDRLDAELKNKERLVSVDKPELVDLARIDT